MSFTTQVTPSIYQINKSVNHVLPIIDKITYTEDGKRVLADNGDYIYLNEPGKVDWFLSTSIPKTHLPLFGQNLNRYKYSDLFEACTENLDIIIQNISNSTYITYTDTNVSLQNDQLLSLETTEEFPSNSIDVSQPYYIINLNTNNKRFQISTTLNGTAINLSDDIISSITGSQKARFYTNQVITPGDYSTNFSLIDARNYFLRCKTDDRVLGSKQDDAFQGHWHFDIGSVYSLNGNGTVADAGSFNRQVLINTAGTVEVAGEHYGVPRVANETRSKNIAAYLCISF